MKRPLVVVSGLRVEESAQVWPMLKRLGRPLYLEATSRLRGHPELTELELQGGERSLKNLNFDGVIRVGNVPTLRYWRDLENSQLPVLNFSSNPLSGMPRVSEVRSLNALEEAGGYDLWSERAHDREIGERKNALLKEFDLSEPAWVRWLSEQMSPAARVLLGNSLPIREWDFAASAKAPRDIYANRGANGIDGLISTFCGLCEPRAENWALLGDLSTLYDLSGPWALSQRPIENFNLVVINNGGGQIFNRMFRDRMFLNEHDLNFEHWANMWRLEYQRLDSPRKIQTGRPQVIEIVPSAEQTEALWAAWEK